MTNGWTSWANPDELRDWADEKRRLRADHIEQAAQLTDQLADRARELRALADELDPPTGWTYDGNGKPVTVSLTKPEPVLTEDQREAYRQHKATAEELDRWAQGREPLIPDVVNGKLHLRQAGRSWPAACEMCGAGNGQPCQAVSE